MRKLPGILLVIFSIGIVNGVPAQEIWVENKQENKCGIFSAGDEYTHFSMPEGWERINATYEDCRQILLLRNENETKTEEILAEHGSSACYPLSDQGDYEKTAQILGCEYVGRVNGTGFHSGLWEQEHKNEICYAVGLIPLLLIGLVIHGKTQKSCNPP